MNRPFQLAYVSLVAETKQSMSVGLLPAQKSDSAIIINGYIQEPYLLQDCAAEVLLSQRSGEPITQSHPFVVEA